MTTGSNTTFLPASVSSISRSQSSSPRKPSESACRTQTLFRAGIYVDVDLPEEVQHQINIVLATPPANAPTLERLASELQRESMELTAAQAGESDWTVLLRETLKGLKSTKLMVALNREWRPDIKPQVHQPPVSRPSVPQKRLRDQTGAQEPENPGSNVASEDPSFDQLARPTDVLGSVGPGTATLPVQPGPMPITPFTLKNPRPDISVGISGQGLATTLQSRQVRNGKYLLNDLQETGELISDPGLTPLNLRFPFFLVEAKSGATGGNLYQAQNQAAVSGASAIEVLKALYQKSEGRRPSNTASPAVGGTMCQLLTFSATTEGPICELWAHFWDEANDSHYMANIDTWRTTCRDKAFDFVSKISTILNWGSATFHNAVVEHLTLFGFDGASTSA
ncbi:hypothetical protein P168DRAFT_232923 [Aspergillus campestris IBT 28561]|uniref:DUF7924 domain-containing protein n=1 Tax=Aspergillus campestris (strain IBT 28561) TaxID=1392248 RepID=A0A2I1D6I6_ASPC2|nr:uncharacterized protein P168DRAFT_232923 [Aspergillus campestris IBT 28561]PKY05492.1 hypothetical protein P168DRAFT_232923 [Aspergillus campestris IBT 28561]